MGTRPLRVRTHRHEGTGGSDLGSPILQHFGRSSRFFRQFPGGAKYLGDVDDVDDVPLIIVATPNAAVVYETDNL